MIEAAEALEVIDKGATSDAHPTPLLFVHGAWHGAWCWDEHFLDFFADRGYRVVALSLRGHGASTLSKPLWRCSIADYVDDVAAVAATLPTVPVLIGHSMGGFVVQKYLESHRVPAGVLLASAPPRGVGGSVAVAWRRHPWLMARASCTGRTLRNVNTPRLAREQLFSPVTPESQVVRYAARLQEESARALFCDMLFWNLIEPHRVRTPMLVLGADYDDFIPAKFVDATARAYGTDAEFIADMGHDMMLEPGWRAAAERIDTWLAERSTRTRPQ